MAEVKVTKENFKQEVLDSSIPVIVDFWAEWCGPCKMLGPVLAEIADENDGKIKVCKINVDEQEELAMQFGIRSIPTMLIFKNGEQTNKQVGFCSKEEVLALLD